MVTQGTPNSPSDGSSRSYFYSPWFNADNQHYVKLSRDCWIRGRIRLFKVAYCWGLRRNEHAREFGKYGVLQVRYGKAVKGSPQNAAAC